MNEKNILIVEDDEITALNLKISLQKQGYNVIAMCNNIIDAKKEITNLKPEIIIIDISLDDSTDGIELAREIRSLHGIPFIYLTSHTDDDIIAEAKTTEPYGYIVKPFDPNSLHATIQMALFKYESEKAVIEEIITLKSDKMTLENLLSSKQDANEPIITFGEGFHLDVSICETFYKGSKIKLTKKENAFLRLLVAQMGVVVSFEQAMKYVWEENGATENSVRTLVWRLRNKLEVDIIKNASGMGYYIEG
ncbi:MAG: DNA-binding response OmpR family regulator [Sulfurimonas sp.]|jgi:DNA-binding response OmpR family regulator|uniref:response regulator transcription factor n=1 Tax=Sulfurimonas sp. TaxID=2022749 RepID=UPI0039E4A775